MINWKENGGQIIDSQQEVGGYPKFKPTYRKLDIPEDNVQKWLRKMADSVK